MKHIRVLLQGLMIVAAGQLFGGEPAADFSIAADVTPGGVMPPGTEGVVTIKVTNFGPDTGTAIFRMRRTDDGTGFFNYPPLHFQFPGALTGPCEGAPLQPLPGEVFLIWIVRELPAGESVECSYDFTVTETSVITQLGRWSIERFSGPQDPNLDNNISDVLLRFAEVPEAIPVPAISTPVLLLLVLLLTVTAFRLHGRRVSE